MPEQSLDRSLAYTALLELHPTFRSMEQGPESTQLVTDLTKAMVEARDSGATDSWAFAKAWIEVQKEKNAATPEEKSDFDPDKALTELRGCMEFYEEMQYEADQEPNAQKASALRDRGIRAAEYAAEYATKLDLWLSAGGTLPTAWQKRAQPDLLGRARLVAQTMSAPQLNLMALATRVYGGWKIDINRGNPMTRKALRARGIFAYDTPDAETLSPLGEKVHAITLLAEEK